jgi:hypothetical protein
MLSRIFGAAVLSAVIGLSVAEGSTITASLFSVLPPSGSSLVLIDLTSATFPSQATLTGSGFSVSFAGVGSDQGLVKGDLLPVGHAVPIAGVAGGLPEYLTGGFGSSLTTDIGASGSYLSSGIGTITIEFLVPRTSFALLWGSIDAGNSLSFNDASHLNVAGTAVQAAAAGFAANGFQGPGGSAYVVVTTDTPFTTITAASSGISFEFRPLAASATALDTANPEPAGLAMTAGGILLLLACGLRTKKRAA